MPLAALFLAEPAGRPAPGVELAARDRRPGGRARSACSSDRRRCAWHSPALLAFVLALGFAGSWDDLVRFIYGGPFGQVDPLLGHDIGFYVFRLPLLERRSRVVYFAALGMLIAQAGLAARLGLFNDWDRLDVATRGSAAAALGWNLAAVGVAASAGYVLDRFHLLYASGGTVWGPGFVDARLVMPALWLMAAGALAVAGLALVAARRRDLRLMAWTVAGAVVRARRPARDRSGVGAGDLRRPERARPRAAVSRAQHRLHPKGLRHRRRLRARLPARRTSSCATSTTTRTPSATSGSGTTARCCGPSARSSRSGSTTSSTTWTWTATGSTDGYRQTLLAARELTPELPERADTWVNRHLQFTHGYGVAMSLATLEGEEGSPTLVVKDLPPVAIRGAPVGNPAIYYGEHMPDFQIVPSGVRELDYPRGRRQRLRELPRQRRGAARIVLVEAALRLPLHGRQHPAHRLHDRRQPDPDPAVAAGAGAPDRAVPAARPRPLHGDDVERAVLDPGRLHHLRPLSLLRADDPAEPDPARRSTTSATA